MKYVKKFVSFLLTVVMALGMTTTVFAAQEGSLTGGSITIKNAVPGQTYNAYQLLYLESYNSQTGAYSYKANSQWETWLRTQTSYLSFDAQGYVRWVEGADTAAFAKLAQAQIGSRTADASATAPEAAEGEKYSTITLSGLKLGYYLIDTTLGTLCSLDTTNPSVEMYEKNEVPDIKKQVKEDSTGKFGESNTAQIGDTVEFRTTVQAKKGAQGYILHDEMSEGLTLNKNSIRVQVNGVDLNTSNYTIITENLTDGCDFEIHFVQSYLDTITADTDIVVTYNAVLNGKAVIYRDANTNTTKLDYGEDSQFETEKKQTKTYTFMFDIIKTDSDKKLLNGAKFELYDAQSRGNKIPLVKEGSGLYRVATKEEASAEGFVSAVIEAGIATVKGMDANTTYWLEEIEAPAGYNKLAGRVEIQIANDNLCTGMTGDTWTEKCGGIQIINKTGTELPSTGGVGTTLFYIIGSVLLLAAVVLLIVRRYMNRKEC